MRTYFGYALVLLAASTVVVRADVVINEFVYDDGGTDDREFVELYNNGAAPVDISGWTLGGQDATGANTSTAISASTILAPGGFWVIGDTGVANVNQVVTAGFLENDAETIELRNGTTLIDAVVYETNKSTTSYGTLPVEVAADVGGGASSPGIWGNNQSNDASVSPLSGSLSTLARYVNGRDTNNNGRDFGLRPGTPGATNNPLNVTTYTVPDVSAGTTGDVLTTWGSAFAPPRVIQPTVADGFLNPNVITAPPTGSDRALVEWDTTGGGNAGSAPETFSQPGKAKFDIYAYLDTTNLPIMTNASAVEFTGSEVTVYAIGGVDSLNNLTDLSGATTIGNLSANGTTGVAWVYEKVGLGPAPGSAPVSEKLFLVDANDGGDSAIGGGMEWTILATVDLSATGSGWHRLSISIGNPGDYNDDGLVDAADFVVWRKAGATDTLPNDLTPGVVDASDYGVWRTHFGNSGGIGVALFDNQTFNFTTAPFVGAFGVAYRENTQLGTDTSPDAIMRPATFVQYAQPLVGSGTGVPEPGTLALCLIGLFGLICSRRSR